MPKRDTASSKYIPELYHISFIEKINQCLSCVYTFELDSKSILDQSIDIKEYKQNDLDFKRFFFFKFHSSSIFLAQEINVKNIYTSSICTQFW